MKLVSKSLRILKNPSKISQDRSFRMKLDSNSSKILQNVKESWKILQDLIVSLKNPQKSLRIVNLEWNWIKSLKILQDPIVFFKNPEKSFFKNQDRSFRMKLVTKWFRMSKNPEKSCRILQDPNVFSKISWKILQNLEESSKIHQDR